MGRPCGRRRSLTDLVSLAEARQLLLQRVREEGEEPGLENENHLRKRRRAGAAARPSRPQRIMEDSGVAQ